MHDRTIVIDDDDESQGLHVSKKSSRKPTGDDPVSDWLLEMYYLIFSDAMRPVAIGLCCLPFGFILFFYVFISSSVSNLIAFITMIISIVFVFVSMWMLCWILDKDQGPRSMQDVSDSIKEGAEGFFKTQYGTIFKLAGVCSVLLFLVYLQRSPATGKSELHHYVSTNFMAFITMLSFLIGANCSALSGYAGIWVSVRANVRVAAASRKCYNEAL
jgi:hypothetical protein